jgi:hypothetical protein
VTVTDVDLTDAGQITIVCTRGTATQRVPIGLLWVVVDRQRRSLQDIVFRTRVIYSKGAR